MSRTRTNARRLPQLSNCIPTAINSTPTTYKQRNDPGTPQVGPQENLTWIHKYPPKGHVPHSQLTLVNYTTPHGLYLDRHPVPYQNCIHTRYWGNKLPHPTNG